MDRFKSRPFCFAGILLLTQVAVSQVAVTTYHNDNARTGQNTQEAVLTPSSVNQSVFGKFCSYSLPSDSYAYAQPLYVPNVSIGGQLRNVIYIATEQDMVYAFDADDSNCSSSGVFWQATLGQPVPTGPGTLFPYAEFVSPTIGVTGTPVIDRTSNTLYVVGKMLNSSGNPVDMLHALDITTGAEKPGSPVQIQASVAGTGTHSSGGIVSFDPRTSNQRAGLIFSNGVVYIAWGAYEDTAPYHGWVVAYAGATLQQLGAFNTTPNGGNFNCTPYVSGCDGKGGGVWTNGAIAGDQDGSIFAGIGNGSFDSNQDYGDSFVKLQPRSLTYLDSFTPFNVNTLNGSDLDVGGGITLLPDQSTGTPHILVSAGKEGRIYVINRDNMGGFHSTDQVVQESGPEAVGASGCSSSASDGCNRTSPAFWNSRVYFHGKDDVVKAFQLSPSNPPLSTSPVAQSTIPYFNPNNPNTRGANPMVSANGSTNGIVWDLRVDDASFSGGPAVLYAYDAVSLSRLYSSDQNTSRDNPGPGQNFISPTIANGKVYVGTRNQVAIYGLLAYKTAQPPTIQFGVNPISGGAPLTVTASTSGSTDAGGGAVASSWIDFGDGTVVNATTANHTYSSAGTYTVIATVYGSSGRSSRTTTTVTVSSNTPPFGFLELINGKTGAVSVAQNSTIQVSGWAADKEDGSPVAKVQVLIDGTAVGNATLGGSRPDVASAYGDSRFTNSGWTFSYNIGTLSTGAHNVTAVATDSAGATATLTGYNGTGPITITAPNTPPFGYLELINGNTGPQTMAQGSTIQVSGWAADKEDGSPVKMVQILIDGAAVGNATLGISRPDVASGYGDPRYANSGWSFSYNTASLSVGSHNVTVVATDSTGATATLSSYQGTGPITITTANTPPFGYLELINGHTGPQSMAQGSTMQVSGWAADKEDGSPVKMVQILIDGAAVGNATVGISRSDVASGYGDPRYANSGWSFSYNTASLSVGSHNVTAVATDSTGATATLSSYQGTGPITITTTGSIASISHVFFMLQENRTFDHYFGMLNPYRVANHWNIGDDGKEYDVDGIDDKLSTISNTNDEGTVFNLFNLQTTCINDMTSAWLESYGDVNRFNFSTTRPVLMDGFVHTAEGYAKSKGYSDTAGKRAMGYYDQGFLNYYYYMASQFAISDRWFSPVSGKTVPNRLATISGGTTQGLVYDPGADDHLGQLNWNTIFQELDNHGVSWKIYYTDTDRSDPFPATTFGYFTYSAKYMHSGTCQPPTTNVNGVCIDTSHIAPLSQYFTDVQNGNLPSFAYIEPGFNDGTDEHPGDNIIPGQQQVAKIVNALMNSPSWKDSVFFLSYDEGGGPYDHVPPVSGHTNDNTDASLGVTTDISSIAVNPDSYFPCPLVSGSYHCDLRNFGSYADPGWNASDAPAQQGFAAQLGFRVPNLVISPFSRRHYVSHVPMDHTAVIKFVETRFIGSSASLTARDAAQPNLLDFFDFNSVPWATPPSPPGPSTASSCNPTNL